MPNLIRGVCVALGLLCWIAPAAGQHRSSDDASGSATYDPSQIWTRPDHGTSSLHTGSGHPGPNYWQNSVEYTIEARLDPDAQEIQGTVTAQYTNNSPTSLSSIWLLTNVPPPRTDVRSARSPVEVQTIRVKRNGDMKSVRTFATDGRVQVRLPEPVSGSGGTTSLSIEFRTAISSDGLPGMTQTPSGPLYGVGEWFPRVAAYSNREGWVRGLVRAPEDGHAEYGSFDYHITVPAKMIVAGSGTLMNPKDVLTADQRRRLMRARDSNRKVAIISPDNAGTFETRPTRSGTLTWHFRMNGARTVAWAASPSFVWNAAKVPRTGRRDALAMSYYPRSSMGGEAWNRSTYHTQKAVRFFSEELFAYPWNNAVSVAGPVGEQAFPGLSFCPTDATGYSLFACSVQNQSHNWFPAIVGSDPAQHPWMDEGLSTYMSLRAHRTLYEGEFSPKRDTEFAPGAGADADRAMAALLRSVSSADGLMGPAPPPPSPQTGQYYSFKAAYGYLLLRDYVLSPERFDYALRQFVQRWAFRAPMPQDLFRTIEDASGTDLSWFWTGWFREAWQVDVGIQAVSYVDGSPEQGARLTLTLSKKLPMPVHATVTEADGDTHDLRLPADIWRRGPNHVAELDTDSRIKRVQLDPQNLLPDVNRSNDTWSSKNL
jgi:hypothetical protein